MLFPDTIGCILMEPEFNIGIGQAPTIVLLQQFFSRIEPVRPFAFAFEPKQHRLFLKRRIRSKQIPPLVKHWQHISGCDVIHGLRKIMIRRHINDGKYKMNQCQPRHQGGCLYFIFFMEYPISQALRIGSKLYFWMQLPNFVGKVKLNMTDANNSTLTSWVQVNKDSDFPIQNLPFGIAGRKNEKPFPAIRIGDQAVNLHAAAQHQLFSNLDIFGEVFSAQKLNPLLALGKPAVRKIRNRVSELLQTGNTELQHHNAVHEILVPLSELDVHMPVDIGDYTDFYSSEQHATNVGTMFRDPNNALLPNWKHIPVGYHGRSSSIILSGQEIHRPKGQTKPADADAPVFGPCRLLDFELEMAFITYGGKPLGQSISTAEADDHIFGMVLFNDWSARDIQTWEYVPLGPFLAKNFASSMSAWIVTMDALEPFRVPGPVQNPQVLPYLKYEGDRHYDLGLQVAITPENGEETVV